MQKHQHTLKRLIMNKKSYKYMYSNENVIRKKNIEFELVIKEKKRDYHQIRTRVLNDQTKTEVVSCLLTTGPQRITYILSSCGLFSA